MCWELLFEDVNNFSRLSESPNAQSGGSRYHDDPYPPPRPLATRTDFSEFRGVLRHEPARFEHQCEEVRVVWSVCPEDASVASCSSTFKYI